MMSNPKAVVARYEEFAEKNRAIRSEVESARARLEHADNARLREVAHASDEPFVTRATALGILLRRRLPGGELADALMPLWNDPEKELARMAIDRAPTGEPRCREGLRKLLDDPREMQWSEAASRLARERDLVLASRLPVWFREGDTAHRNVAWACIEYGAMEPADRMALLREAWSLVCRDDDDRVLVAIGLLKLGDPAGVPFLESVCLQAESMSAAYAAWSLYEHDRRLGLTHIRWISDLAADEQLRWHMAHYLVTSKSIPEINTPRMLDAARQWLARQSQASA